MILPTLRASFDRGDAMHLVGLLGRDDPELLASAKTRLREGGIDALLDDPRIRNALLTHPEVKAPPTVIFYVLVRQALLEGGIDDREAADFVASLLVAFGQRGRAYRVTENSDEEFHYLVDLVARIPSVGPREAFMTRAHLGNFALWLCGLFPDFLEARTRRRGAPPIDYYEEMGATGYRLASESPEAAALGVDRVYGGVADRFQGVRRALNRVSDRYLWPKAGDPVGRLLREVSERGGEH